MKKCPRCGTTYTDLSLRFCLADGSPLEDIPADEPTLAGTRQNQMRVDIPPTQQAFQPPVRPAGKSSSGRWIKIALGLLVLAGLGIGLLVVAGVLLYYRSAGRDVTVAAKTPTPTPNQAASPTPDSEKEKLQDELSNLQRKLEEEKRSSVNTSPFPPDTGDQRGTLRTATVNSPNDGFLALRSLPDADLGDRIAKIPHGSTVQVISCADDVVTIGGRSGHWCLITYRSSAGFAFDGFLDY